MEKQENSQYGWICPRCDKVNAPWKSECDCNKNDSSYQHPSSPDFTEIKPTGVGYPEVYCIATNV